MPLFFSRRKKQKLEATARRAMPQAGRDFAEPNMKLSNAMIVVLILHVVAVGGIYAFSSIKAHRSAAMFEPPEKKEIEKAKPAATQGAPENAQQNQHPAPPGAGDKTSDAAAKKSAVLPQKTGVKDTGEIYTVKSGDKLTTIARKLKVNADDLIKLNKISDPKKLQIGQKLRIPAKRTDS